jgi:hypothetical protein
MPTVGRPDWTDILPDESLIEWLQRTDPTRGWILDGDNLQPIGPLDAGDPMPAIWQLRPAFSEAAWNSWRDHTSAAALAAVKADTEAILAEFPIPSPPTAPVWPGSAGVTFGTPVALADQLVVDQVMDGLLVSVTTPPGKLGSYRLGGVTLDYGAGRVAFENDAGELEMWQYLGFREAIYTPRSMQHASKARFQVLGGAEGTVTPWTKS